MHKLVWIVFVGLVRGEELVEICSDATDDKSAWLGKIDQKRQALVAIEAGEEKISIRVGTSDIEYSMLAQSEIAMETEIESSVLTFETDPCGRASWAKAWTEDCVELQTFSYSFDTLYDDDKALLRHLEEELDTISSCEYTDQILQYAIEVDQTESQLIRSIPKGETNVWLQFEADADINLKLTTSDGTKVLEYPDVNWEEEKVEFNEMSFIFCVDDCTRELSLSYYDGKKYEIQGSSSLTSEYIFINETKEDLYLYLQGFTDGSGTLSVLFDCPASCTSCTAYDTISGTTNLVFQYYDIEYLSKDTVIFLETLTNLSTVDQNLVSIDVVANQGCAPKDEETYLEVVGEESAEVITAVTSVAIATSVSSAVGTSTVASGGAGAGAGGGGGMANGASDILSVIAQVQFVVLASQLSLPLDEGFRSMGSGLQWINFQFDFTKIYGRIGKRYSKDEATKGIQAGLASAKRSAEEMMMSTIFCGVLFFVFGIGLHLGMTRAFIKLTNKKKLPAILTFPVPEILLFWVYALSAFNSGFITVAISSDPLFILLSWIWILLIAFIFFTILSIVLDPVCPQKGSLKHIFYARSTSLSDWSQAKKDKTQVNKSQSTEISFVLAKNDIKTSKDRWTLALSDPMHKLGSWESKSEDDSSYEAWIIQTFALAFDRMTNALSFFCLEAFYSKFLFSIFLVSLSGTNGNAQVSLALVFSILKLILLVTYVPFNGFMGNIREIVTATSHVILFIVPFLTFDGGISWKVASKVMLFINLIATLFVLFLQIIASLFTLLRTLRKLIFSENVPQPINTAVIPQKELSKVVSVAGKENSAYIMNTIQNAVIETLLEPFNVYQSTFRSDCVNKLLKDQPVDFDAAHNLGLVAARDSYKNDITIKNVAKNNAKLMAEDAAKVVLDSIKTNVTNTVTKNLHESDPVLSNVPYDTLKKMVAFVTGYTIDTVFSKALDKLSKLTDTELETENASELAMEELVPKDVQEQVSNDDDDEADDDDELESEPQLTVTVDPILESVVAKVRKVMGDQQSLLTPKRPKLYPRLSSSSVFSFCSKASHKDPDLEQAHPYEKKGAETEQLVPNSSNTVCEL